MLSCPIKSASKEISLNLSKKLLANLCLNEWGYITLGFNPYLIPNFFNSPPIPRVVILFPYLFLNINPLDKLIVSNHSKASSCKPYNKIPIVVFIFL